MPAPYLSLVAPMYNEAETIAAFIAEATAVATSLKKPYELILVDDGSTDGSVLAATAASQKNANLRILVLSRNFGKENALTAGLAAAKGQVIAIMDSDLQDPPTLLPALLDKLEKENLDTVYAARLSRDGEGWLKRLTSHLFYATANHTTGLKLESDSGDFRVLTARVKDALLASNESHRALKMLYAYVGFKSGKVPYHRPARAGGTTKFNWRKLTNHALDGILAFSTTPLRYMSALSLTASLGLLAYAAYVVIRKLILGEAILDGWTSIMAAITILFSFNFLFLALISEYIGRILTETKKRPLYFIQNEIRDGKVQS